MLCVSAVASADLIAGWTIPTRFPIAPNPIPTGTSYLVPLAVNPDGSINPDPNVAGSTPWNPALAGRADVGARALQEGFALGSVHQLAFSGSTPTSYTSTTGNGSPYAFSSNVWKAGDYYQATFVTTGYSDISFSWDMTRSSTGPATWIVEMSVNGGTFMSVLESFALSSAISFTSTTYNPAATTTLSLGVAAADAATVSVRIRALVDGQNGTGAFAPGGTARIDNVMVNGNVIPAPGAVFLLGLAGLVARRRRR